MKFYNYIANYYSNSFAVIILSVEVNRLILLRVTVPSNQTDERTNLECIRTYFTPRNVVPPLALSRCYLLDCSKLYVSSSPKKMYKKLKTMFLKRTSNYNPILFKLSF